MELQALKVTKRAAGGSSAAGRTRRTGVVPAVLYGGGHAPASLSVNLRAFESLIHHSRGGEHAIVRLEVEDAPELDTPALLKEVQHDPLRGSVIHADFLRIRLDERIETVVPIRLIGQAPGIAEGGVLDHQLRDLEIECLALDVPEEVVVDVSNLHMNDSIHVSQLTVPENVSVRSDPERPVVAVHPPRVIKEAAPEAAEGAEAAAEGPEVITERKEKDEDEDKDKGKDKKK
jgi:large subunit ribosomal protein L25